MTERDRLLSAKDYLVVLLGGVQVKGKEAPVEAYVVELPPDAS